MFFDPTLFQALARIKHFERIFDDIKTWLQYEETPNLDSYYIMPPTLLCAYLENLLEAKRQFEHTNNHNLIELIDMSISGILNKVFADDYKDIETRARILQICNYQNISKNTSDFTGEGLTL